LRLLAAFSSTLVWFYNQTDSDVTIEPGEFVAQADEQLLRSYVYRPRPAIPTDIVVPKQAWAAKWYPTYLLPRGLSQLSFTGTRGAKTVVPARTDTPAQLGSEILATCPAKVTSASSITTDGLRSVNRIDSDETYLVEQVVETKTLHAYVHGPCPSTAVDVEHGVGPLAPDQRNYSTRTDTALTDRNVELIVPQGLLDVIGTRRLWVRNRTANSVTRTLTIDNNKLQIRLKPRETRFITVPASTTRPPYKIQWGKSTFKATGVADRWTTHPQVGCDAIKTPDATLQRLYETNEPGEWFHTDNSTRQTTYRVIAGNPRRILGYLLGPC
jgi:hypothetical protein